MIDTDDPGDVIAAGGKFTTGMTSATGGVGRIVDDMVVHTEARSAFGKALVEKLIWVQGTFEQAVRETDVQARTTLDVTRLAATSIGNADIDGSVVVRHTET